MQNNNVSEGFPVEPQNTFRGDNTWSSVLKQFELHLVRNFSELIVRTNIQYGPH